MKKQVAFAVAAALSLSVAGTALPVSAANPFVDVPANHWAYDAVDQLQKDGVISGYGDGSFRGDRTLTRYEMAAMIAKITNVDDKNSALVKRLQSEFGNELYNMGVRVDALEKNASSIKFSGAAMIRYQQGPFTSGNAVRFEDDAPKSSRIQERVWINMGADVTDNVKFTGSLLAENTSNRDNGTAYAKQSYDDQVIFQRAEFAWTNGKLGLSAGRLNPVIGQGYVWGGGRTDGVLFKYNGDKVTFATGYGDVRSEFDKTSQTASPINMYLAHLGFNVTENVTITGSYLKMNNPRDRFDATTHSLNTSTNPLLQNGVEGVAIWGVGGKAKFGKATLNGEYFENTKAEEQKKGARAKLQIGQVSMKEPGSKQFFVEYLRLGGNASLGNGTATGFVASNNKAIFGDGIKGWGAGIGYTLAKNVNFTTTYHWNLKTFDGSKNYHNAFTAATTFAF